MVGIEEEWTDFEGIRSRLQAIAYRMLGTREDAEDVVQETFLRWHQARRSEVESPERWLVTACVRLSIDFLRSAYRKRKTYVGPWLPEPFVAAAGEASSDPLELAESLTTAFLLLLERLSPVERAAFLLHDVFGYAYAELAETLGRSEAACRQIVSRARKRVGEPRARFSVEPDRAEELLGRFVAAARAGAVEPLKAMLASEAELWTDGGGKVTAARNVIHGAEPIARFLVGIAARLDPHASLIQARVNASPGLITLQESRVVNVVSARFDATGRMVGIYIVSNPEKLRFLEEGHDRHPFLPASGSGQG